MRRVSEDGRTLAQLREHYELEKRLAARLRSASAEERKHLYNEVYNELYSSIPHHPRNTRQHSPEEAQRHVASQISLLRSFLRPNAIFMEIGPGDCGLTCAVAQYVAKAYGIEVSDVTMRREQTPANFEALLFDGCNIPLAPESVDIAYSSSVMEHLHPDDALAQLHSIARTLTPGGIYIVSTPHRYLGPGDISKYFDTEATGFHLKEYTFYELDRLMRTAGFAEVQAIHWKAGRYLPAALDRQLRIESILGRLPYAIRYEFARRWPMQRCLEIHLLATKA